VGVSARAAGALAVGGRRRDSRGHPARQRVDE
jgi:hypothetical protein